MNIFSTIPFFRILIPFAAGILIALRFDPALPSPYLFIPFLTGAFLFAFLKQNNRFTKVVFMLLADVMLCLFGLSLTHLSNLSHAPSFYSKLQSPDSIGTFVVEISDIAIRKEKFTKYPVKVLYVKKGTKLLPATGNLLVYLRNQNNTSILEPGERLCFSKKLSEVQGPMNPGEFDYRAYLQRKQVYHTVFVEPTDWRLLTNSKSNVGLQLFALRCKARTLDILKHSDLTPDAYAICAALLTGYDDDINKEVMQAFSHSGTLHVLSVSGLHTGLIYLVLNFLFNLIDKHKKYKLSRLVILTVLLWLFALLTGFSAPVLRAVIMFNLIGIGAAFFRHDYRNQINILLVSAFILLCYNPFFIVDIGFLLSYFAMFGLLYFQPRLSLLWQPVHPVARYLWQSITASFAATLSTLPLTLFFFKQFPIWFFVCNLVVVPITFILLLAAFLLLLHLPYLSMLINSLVAFTVWFIQLFNHEHVGYLDGLHINWIDLLALSFLLLFLSLALQKRSYQWMRLSIFTLVLWQLISLAESYRLKTKSELVVFYHKRELLVSVKNTGTCVLNQIDTASYAYSVKPALTGYNYPTLNQSQYNYVRSPNEVVLFLSDRSVQVDSLAKVTTLVLSHNRLLRPEALIPFRSLKRIVTDATNNQRTILQTADLCRNFGYEFYNIKQHGAFVLALK